MLLPRQQVDEGPIQINVGPVQAHAIHRIVSVSKKLDSEAELSVYKGSVSSVGILVCAFLI